MRLGNFEVAIVSEGWFKIDAGVMFGVVPRTVWGKVITPDSEHKITLALTMFLVKTPLGNIWIEAGVGDNCDPKWLRVYQVKRERTIAALLAREQLTPELIDYVILTHLHFDHCGGIAAADLQQLTFPKASYVIQREEWETALKPHMRLKDSYPESELQLLARKGELMLVEGTAEIMPGVRVEKTGGHSKGHQVVHLESQGEHLLLAGDLIPLPGNLHLSWISSIDFQPEVSLEQKHRLLQSAARNNWHIAFSHSLEYGRVKADKKNYVLIQDAPAESKARQDQAERGLYASNLH